MWKLRRESQEGQAIGWRPRGHQSSNKIEDRGDPQNAALGLFLSDPRPHPPKFPGLKKSETKFWLL